MMKKPSLRLWKTCQNGNVTIESALILPILLLLYFGMLDVTKLIGDYRKTATIAGMVADLIAQNQGIVYFPGNDTDAAASNLKDYFNVASMVMKPQSDNKLRIVVANYGMVSGTFQLKWVVNNSKTASCSTSPTNAGVVTQMQGLSENLRDVIFVQACTETQLYYGHILGGLVTKLPDDLIEVGQYVLTVPRTRNFMECYTSTAKTSGVSDCPKT